MGTAPRCLEDRLEGNGQAKYLCHVNAATVTLIFSAAARTDASLAVAPALQPICRRDGVSVQFISIRCLAGGIDRGGRGMGSNSLPLPPRSPSCPQWAAPWRSRTPATAYSP